MRPRPSSGWVTPSIDAAAGKALAVLLFCLGARTLADTIRAFDAHPEWREA